MDLQAGSLAVGDFFVTVDQVNNIRVFIMRVGPTALNDGLCQDINDMTFWSIVPERYVRKIPKEDHYKSAFYA